MAIKHIRGKSIFILLLISAFIILLVTTKVNKTGITSVASTPELRAQEIGFKQCYTNQDIEYIVFGEIQE